MDPDPQHWHKKAPHTVYLAAGLLCLVDEDIDLICEDVDLLLYLLLLVGRDPVGGGLLHLGEEQALLAPLDLVAQVVQHPLAESTRQKNSVQDPRVRIRYSAWFRIRISKSGSV